LRVLLDESLHRGVKNFLTGHDVSTVREVGWSSIANGELLRRASEEFDVLVTADQGIPHQQNLSKFDIAVVILVAKSNRLQAYGPLAQQLRDTIEIAKAGVATYVTA
jgi:uncharacterized protein DUF5615